MPRMLGKRALLEILRAEGVRYIFGNPGTTEGAIMHALEDFPDLAYILVTQEGVAMGMADAYARATGRPAFVNLHIETGLANGLSLLFNAFAGGTPLVLTSANSDVRKLAAGRTDLTELTRPFTKWSAEITHVEQFPSVMRRAFTEANTPPTGPTFVSFTPNALEAEAELEITPSPAVFARAAPDPAGIERAVALLAAAERPALLLGDRVAQYDASAQAVELAQRLGARVYGASYPAMSFPTDHPLWVADLKPYARFYRETLGEVDVLLAVGCKVFHDFFRVADGILNSKAKLIHIDINAAEIGQSQPTDVGILADPKAALAVLDAALRAAMSSAQASRARARTERIAVDTSARREAFGERLESLGSHTPMLPDQMMAALATALPDDAVLVDDAVSSRTSLHAALTFQRPGSILAERAGGAIGWGMGATLGAALAHPDRPVVGVIGDGSAMMTVQALWTSAAYQIPATFVICNNGSYRVLKLNLHTYFQDQLGRPDLTSRYIGMDFEQPFDLAAIARAMGVHGERIEDPSDLGPALGRARDSGKPALLDVVIDGSV